MKKYCCSELKLACNYHEPVITTASASGKTFLLWAGKKFTSVDSEIRLIRVILGGEVEIKKLKKESSSKNSQQHHLLEELKRLEKNKSRLPKLRSMALQMAYCPFCGHKL